MKSSQSKITSILNKLKNKFQHTSKKFAVTKKYWEAVTTYNVFGSLSQSLMSIKY